MDQYAAVPQAASASMGPGDAPGRSDGGDIELDSFDSADLASTPEHLSELAVSPSPRSSSPEGKLSMRMAFMNMANSILGAGIIGQPFAFRNSGLAGGVLVMALLTYLIDWTLRLIVVNAAMSSTHLYQDTVHHCFGLGGKWLLLFAISSFAYGGCMAFCIIIGDTIPHVLRAFVPEVVTLWPATAWLFHRNAIIVIFTTCISYPLLLNRDISKLARASGFALLGMLVIVVLTVVRAPMADAALKAPLTAAEWGVNVGSIFQGILVISFALVCHHNTLFIYNSLERASVLKFARLTHIACAVSMVCCLVMGVNGLLGFGGNTKGNILNNFRSDDNWINVARFCFGLNMLTTFPLEVFVVRDVLKDVVLAHASDTASTAHLELSRRQHFFITTFLVFSTMSVSLFTCNLGIILELIGLTSALLMAYIIPPLCFLKLKYDALDYHAMPRADQRTFVFKIVLPTAACAVFGVMIMFISSYLSIVESIHDTSPGHCVVD
jgi:sodium-coupled neutral amino acid transporter 11